MKKIILIVFIILCLSIYCKKDNKNNADDSPKSVVDYRDKYIGDYNCHCIDDMVSMEQIIRHIDTIKVIKVTKIGDSLLNILNVNCMIISNGEFFHTTSDHIYQYFGGYFKNDNILIRTYSGGLGVWDTSNCKGVKL